MNSIIKMALLLFLVHGVSSCASLSTQELVYPTLSEVRKKPDLYDGKVVTLRAHLSMSHENYNLWASLSDLKNGRTDRCISLENYEWLRDRSAEFDGKYVQVTGTFHRDIVGHRFIVRLEACSNAALVLSPGISPIVIP